METQSEVRNPIVEAAPARSLFLLSSLQVKVMIALLIIGTGLVFSLTASGRLSWASPWWVLYIAIPSVMLLFAAAAAIVRQRVVTRQSSLGGLLGMLGLSLSLILAFDPTWSFTRAWHFDEAFPFLRGMPWNSIWQWALVLLGTAGLIGAVIKRNVVSGIIGALIVMTGGTFLLNLAWDSVWPLMIVVVGVGLLFQVTGKK